MDLEQRYTEEMSLFEVDDWFVLKLKDYPLETAIDIATQVENSIDALPKKLGITQYIAGVSDKEDEEVYFETEITTGPLYWFKLNLSEGGVWRLEQKLDGKSIKQVEYTTQQIIDNNSSFMDFN